METGAAILLLALLAAAGVAAAYYFFWQWRAAQRGAEAQQSSLTRAQTQLEAEQGQRARLQAELDSARDRLRDKEAGFAALQEELKNERQSAQERHAAQQAEFRNMAQGILEEKSRKFSEESKAQLQPLINPLKDDLKSFREKVEALHGESTKERSALREHIDILQKNASQISADASNLTNALTASGKVQGDWGEHMLEKLLENSGLIEGENYRLQDSHDTGEGRQMRPDAVIYLPEGKHLIIDAKVSLRAYAVYTATEDKTARGGGD